MSKEELYTITHIPASEIKVGNRLRKELDVEPLCKSISEFGLFHPIAVTEDNWLVTGYRLLTALIKLGWKNIPARVLKFKHEVQTNV